MNDVLLEPDDIYFQWDVEQTSYPNTEFDLSGDSVDEFRLQDVEITYSGLETTERSVDAGVSAGAKGFVDAALPLGRRFGQMIREVCLQRLKKRQNRGFPS